MALGSRIKTSLVILFTGAAVCFGWLNLLDRIQWTSPSDGVRWIQKGGELIAGRLVGLQSSDAATGIQPGDRLIAIHSLPVNTFDDYTEVLETLSETLPPDVPVDYTVRKADSGEAVSFPVLIQRASRVGYSDLFLVLVAFSFLGVGLFILLRHWRTAGAFHFYLICLVAFILFFFRHSGRADTLDVVVYWWSAVAFLLLPPLFLHFCCYFPKPLVLLRRAPGLKLLFYLPGASLLAIHIFWFTGILKVFGLPRTESVSIFLDRMELTYFITFFGLAALVLQKSRLKASVIERQQMKWVTLGTTAGLLPFLLLYAIPYLLGWPVSVALEASVLSLALIPLSFAYAITRYRLMDVELIFKRGAAYVLASAALLGMYVGLVLISGHLIPDLSPQSGFVILGLVALLVAILFAPLKNLIQERLDRLFYKDQFDQRRSFADFASTLVSEINMSRLVQRISIRLQTTFQTERAAVAIREDTQSDRFIVVGRNETEAPEIVWNISDDILHRLDLRHPATPDHTDSFEAARVREQLAAFGIHYIKPLQIHGRIMGFIGLGRRYGERFLSSEDLDLIGILADYAAIALDNALLYQSLELKANELTQLKVFSDNVVESITVGVAVISPDGQISVWNNSLQRITGIPREIAVGQHIEEVLPAGFVQSLRRLIGPPLWVVGETLRLYKTHLAASEAHSKLVNVTLAPFVQRDDTVTGTLLILDDVTEKVRLENQLLQAEKLSSIGLFAAGVAHEVNTPLAGISSYAQMLLKETPKDDPRRDMLERIEKQSFRASSIVNNLLNFARFSETEVEEVSVNSLMMETFSLLEHQFRNGKIDVKLDLDPALPKTLGSGGKLQQVFLNLFMNARDAMPTGGELRVRTYHQDSTLVVEVHDSGEGIPPEHINKIYDPFFTTKEVGKGTGLGLSVSYGILQEHSGQINVESQPGKGTTFLLYLPIKRIN